MPETPNGPPTPATPPPTAPPSIYPGFTPDMEGMVPADPSKHVAILGFGDSYKTAPFDDHTVEIWGLNELWKYLPRWDRWFEPHDDKTLGISKRDLSEGEVKRHLAWLERTHPPTDHAPTRPIYMQPQFCGGDPPRFPNATPLPLDRLCGIFGRYFTSTIGYMIAMAIAEGYTSIGLYGIDLASDIEYPGQRPNSEYLVGVARGLGRTVTIASTSAMLKAEGLYGFDPPFQDDQFMLAVGNHQTRLKKQHEECLATLNTLDGAIQECENIRKLVAYRKRGSHVETY